LAHDDIVRVLRIDPGQRTLGQLLQERERAANEIDRLRAQIDQLRTVPRQVSRTPSAPTPTSTENPVPFRAALSSGWSRFVNYWRLVDRLSTSDWLRATSLSQSDWGQEACGGPWTRSSGGETRVAVRAGKVLR